LPCIVLFGDDEPETISETAEAIKDMNQAIPLSPTGSIQGVFGMGDMTKDAGTMLATMNSLDASTLNGIAQYFVIGNHEYNSRSSTYPLIQARLKAINPLSKFSGDSTGNTYYVNIDRLNIWVLNIYSVSSGGAVSQAMFDWLNEYTKVALGYKIVIAHDPMYPTSIHKGNSLDADLTMRNKLQNMFIANKVNAFVGGHEHFSTVQNIDGIFHICSGVIGPGTDQGEDAFATLNYIFVDNSGNLVLQRTQDVSNSWASPKKILTTIGTGGLVQTPTPIVTPTPTPTQPPGDMTLAQLAAYPKLVAINGEIRDLSSSPTWGTGSGHKGHTGGKDLTTALLNEHGLSKVSGFPKVGNVITATPTPIITPTPTPTPNPGTTYLFSFATFPEGASINIIKPTPKPTPLPIITPVPTATPPPPTSTPQPWTPQPTTPTPKPAPSITDLVKIRIDSVNYKVEAKVNNHTSNTKVEFWDGSHYKSTATSSPYISKTFTIDHTIKAKLYENGTYIMERKENFSPG